jgi:GT2 family glycosyltransferase
MPFNTTIVIITRNRAEALRTALGHLGALPERPPVVGVDNGSTDHTAQVVAQVNDIASRRVTLMELPRNAGAAARNLGVRAAATPYVAFSDDDSWWAPGALARSEALFAANGTLGLIAARVLVGAHQRVDPVCLEMRESPLPASATGPSVLGFVACGAVVRRDAFLEAGGFHARYGVGGEERLLAIELVRRGWALAYREDIIAHHHPHAEARPGRRPRQVRNDLWTTWLRRRTPAAWRATVEAAREAMRDADARSGLAQALLGLPWILAERAPVNRRLDAELARVSSR